MKRKTTQKVGTHISSVKVPHFCCIIITLWNAYNWYLLLEIEIKGSHERLQKCCGCGLPWRRRDALFWCKWCQFGNAKTILTGDRLKHITQHRNMSLRVLFLLQELFDIALVPAECYSSFLVFWGGVWRTVNGLCVVSGRITERGSMRINRTGPSSSVCIDLLQNYFS